METAKHIIIVLIFALLTTGTSVSQESEISNTRTASCIVKITANPGILQLNYEIIDSLMRSSSVAGKARREVLKVPPDSDNELFFIVPLPDNSIGRTQQDIAPPQKYEGLGSELKRPRSLRLGTAEEEMSEYDYEMLMVQEIKKDMQRMSEFTPKFDIQPESSRSRTRSRPTRATTGPSRRTGALSPPTRPARSSIAPLPAVAVQTFLFELDVELPDDVTPRAEEFAKALVNNLRETLNDAYEVYHRDELFGQLHGAEAQRERAESKLQEAIEQARSAVKIYHIEPYEYDAAVYEQLEQIVDLSELRPEMTFEEVINIIMTKVDPPLQINPNWRDLEENIDIDRNTIADMDPLASVKLRKALEVLLNGLSVASLAELKYIVDEGVISIATTETIQPKMITAVYEVSGLIHAAADRNSLIEAIEETIEPDSWFDSDMATISLVMGNKLSIYQTPEVHQKIRKFIESIPIEIPPESTVDIPVEDFLQEKHQLIRDKRRLEMDIARSEARQRAIEEQITRISHQTASRVEEDTVTAGLDRILENQNQQLAQLKLGVERGQISPKELADAEEKIFRTKIELAQRQEQLIKSRGGDQLARYNAGLADIMIELAEKKAEIMVIDKQLNQTESQFATATAIDSRIEKIRMAKEALDRAQNRVNELNMHIADMQPPTVAVIGVD